MSRTDVFSLGLVLCEMATGRPAFTGETSAVISGAILHQEPLAPRHLRPELPARLDDIILKALEKDRDLRYQSAAELRADLKRLKRDVESQPGQSVGSAMKTSPDATATGTAHAPSSDAQMVAALVKGHRGSLAAIAALLVLALAGGVYLVTRPPTIPSLSDLNVVQLTTSGTAERPAISPDGRYVAYVQRDGPSYSVWIRQTATASNVQIMRAPPGVGLDPTVTPDGNFVDVVRGVYGSREVWRVPFLGGSPRRLIENVVSPVGWSPDAAHLAFLREDSDSSEFSLVVTDADGSHERVLATRHRPAFFITLHEEGNPGNRPAWSPDGHTLAVMGADAKDGHDALQVVFVDVGTGSVRTRDLTMMHDGASLAWLDVRSVLLNGASTDAPLQLWRLSYPEGPLVRVTNDVNTYTGVSLTADRNDLVTTRSETRVGLWAGTAAAETGTDVALPLQGTPKTGQLTWAGDALLYTNSVSGHDSISRLVPERGTSEEIISNATDPAATSDGRTIVYTAADADPTRAGLWRVDADGRGAVHLVSGDAYLPQVTPDNQHVIFLSQRSGFQSLWIVSIAGGTPTQIVNLWAGSQGWDVSPDSRSVVFSPPPIQSKRKWVVCNLPVCTTRQNMAQPENRALGRIRWTPDGRAIAYVDAPLSNIWVLPLGGQPPQPLTHFTDGRAIADFAWSRDGKRLAIGRFTTTNDIVLFKGLQKALTR